MASSADSGFSASTTATPSWRPWEPNTELNKPFTPIDLGPEYNAQYGFQNPTTDFRNSNVSPHFPYTAQIWKSLWGQQSGINVDGVIAIDPVALSYILGAVGSLTMPDGETVTKDNVVELTESTLYSRFPTDQTARKQYLQDVASEVVRKITVRSNPRDSCSRPLARRSVRAASQCGVHRRPNNSFSRKHRWHTSYQMILLRMPE